MPDKFKLGHYQYSSTCRIPKFHREAVTSVTAAFAARSAG